MSVIGGPKIYDESNLVLSLNAADKNSYIGSGTLWEDLIGTNNGTLTNGPTFSSANGGVIVLDGTNDNINFSSTNFGSIFSTEHWIRPTFNTNTSQTIIANRGNGCAINGFHFFINTFATNDQKLYVEFGNGTTCDAVASDAGAIPYDQWSHVILTVNKSTTTVQIYLNGVKVAEKTTMSINFNTTATFRLGYTNANAYPLKGSLGAFSYYSTVLSQSQILNNYNVQKSRFGL